MYIPVQSSTTPALSSFSAPLVNLHDTHVTAPFFGPNVWNAVLQPVPGGGLTTSSSYIEVKMTFKEGGAYEFQTKLEVAKERLVHAVEMARERNLTSNSNNVDLTQVNLDELPAYEAQPTGQQPSTNTTAGPDPNLNATLQPDSTTSTVPLATTNDPADSNANPAAAVPSPTSHQPLQHSMQHQTSTSDATQSFQPPSEPPPGYEEAQQQSVTEEFERRLSQNQREE